MVEIHHTYQKDPGANPANTQTRSPVMEQLTFDSLAQRTAEAWEHSWPWEHVPGTGTIEDCSLPLKMAFVEEWSQWLCVTEDWAAERRARGKNHLGRQNLQEICSRIQRKTLALEVKVRQSLNINSKTAVVKVFLQNYQHLNSIHAFLFYCKASQVPRVTYVIPELSQVSSSEKFIMYLTSKLEQELETLSIPTSSKRLDQESVVDLFCHHL